MSAEYRLTGRIEAGELAELYKAVRGREPVVIKLFHPRTSDLSYARELAETARTLSGLGHPAILQVLELGLVRERLAVVRQSVEGFTLGQALQRLNTKEVILPPALALSFTLELLDLVQKAHEAGVLHGAVTPGNVMLSKEGRVSVCDFGALRALNAAPALRKVFGARGRASYRAPELAKGEEPTEASDLYSLGAIAYELLTLREPSAGKGAAVSTRHEAVPAPSRLDRRINSRLDPIIMRCLDPAPGRRYRSCGELAQALRGFIMAGGGMPSREDAKRFVGELFPNEVNVQNLGPVPFAEPFTLGEVSGAYLAPAAERSMVLMPRPSFSGGEVPVVGEDEVTSETEPGEEPGPDAVEGWHAPPGAAPQKKLPAAGSALVTGARTAYRRVRVIEDFQALPQTEEAPPTVEVPASLPAPATVLSLEVSQPISESGFPRVPGEDGGRSRRMITEERGLYRAALRQKRLLWVVAGIAALGALTFGVGVWRTSGPKKAVKSKPAQPVRPPAPAPLVREAPPEETSRALRPILPPVELREDWHQPPTKGAAFLSLVTDIPATVFIDGARVRTPTPLKKYPVAPGRQTIAVVAQGSGERREFPLKLVKGQWMKLEERFGPRR